MRENEKRRRKRVGRVTRKKKRGRRNKDRGRERGVYVRKAIEVKSRYKKKGKDANLGRGNNEENCENLGLESWDKGLKKKNNKLRQGGWRGCAS